MQNPKTRRLVAIMFTDIVGYTALMQRDETAAAGIRARHRQVFQDWHNQHQGEILQYFGDGTLSVFQSGVQAVECAFAIQKAMREGTPSIPLRIGLHLGDIVFDGTEIYGDSVNLTSRIESMSVAGAVLISGKLNDELKNQGQLSTQSLGQFSLKNIAEPVEVFALTNPGVKIPERTELKGKQSQQSKSIAVLPFANLSGQADQEYLCDGMTEEIITALSRIKHLRVTSRTSSFFFKNKNIPIPKIGSELNVSTILEGSIRLAGNKMRITAQLIDVVEDYHFWSETFDRSLDDIFAVQDEISLLIADKLREHIGHLEIDDHLVEPPPVSVDVYKDYLRSHYHLTAMNQVDIERGITILENVLKVQPDYPLAHLGMHTGYTMLGTMGFMPPAEAFMKGQQYLDRALELDENIPEAQLHLAWMCLLQKWDIPATYRHLNKVIEVRPMVDYYQTMASTLAVEGKFSAGLNYINTALQLDPFSEINHHLKGFFYYLQEQYETALEFFRQTIQIKPGSMVSILYWGEALILMGKAEESLAFFQSQPDIPGDLTKLGGTTLAYAALGQIEQAEAGVTELEAALATDTAGRAIQMLIYCQTALGQTEAALGYIEKGIEQRIPLMVYLHNDPILKPLFPLPRFQVLMEQIVGSLEQVEAPRRKYKKSLLSDTQMSRYKEQLEQLMQAEQPYLDPSLSLRELAQRLEMPPNQLSQLLNDGFDKNFAEFVNTYRLETFKSKAADPANRQLTILALAYDSGFNSKTVFNTFFKKKMGKTPRAYWNEVVG